MVVTCRERADYPDAEREVPKQAASGGDGGLTRETVFLRKTLAFNQVTGSLCDSESAASLAGGVRVRKEKFGEEKFRGKKA